MPTIHDIARESGVSVRTVSRVLNGSDAVETGTRERVLAVMARLDYRPDPGARSLKTKRRRVVGFVVNAVASDTTMRRVETVARRFGPLGYAVMVAWADGLDAEEREIRELSMRSDALVLFSNRPGPRAAALDRLDAEGFPFLLVDPPGKVAYPAFYVDRSAGYRAATAALAASGRRRIALLVEDFRADERIAGWKQGLADAGMPPDPSLVFRTGKGFEGGRDAADALFARASERPDAVLCHNDRMAAGLLAALPAFDIRAPRDLALVGFDDEPWAPFLDPPLSSIRQAGQDLGEALFEAVNARLSDGAPFVSRIFITEPVPRASAPAPASARQ
ncbi:MAG: LacI family DNA-binding transcriptional regulator [Spirochaetales bacterium]|nr:LacI family DNA-binding transcriptional regulator [Spirochaetales bacterium]